MYTITFIFFGGDRKPITLKKVPAGQTILEVALEHGISLGHECGGISTCGTCHIGLTEGNERLEPMAKREKHCLDKVPSRDGWSRLACQCLLLPGKGRILINLPDQP